MQQRTNASNPTLDSFGLLLKQWRSQRGFSQLDLAVTSQVSQRHISFLESGRAKPSREMVLQLAEVLEIPLRQQNLMLTAAGFTPIHAETDLSAPEMASIRKAIDFMLRQQEPYPAIVVDRYWNLLLTNHAANRLLNAFIAPEELQAHFYRDGKVNLMRAMFHPQGFRPFVINWDDFSVHLLQRLHREAIAEGESEQSKTLLNELMSYPGIAEVWQPFTRTTQNAMLLTVHLKRGNLELEFFSTIATLGTPYDITLQELRIECLFPANDSTEHHWKQLLKS
ncbi:helix-turn-helix domain-containing protein [Leptolyngbya sp. FACHB-711]|uniref:helix-turn-helix domain-containing protein n=1 Tax=Leptolyngbya sp. FACHB-711 TaxID=2692813 RepID=UPI0016827E5E|nr:helix-turn-helix domain-containing protein [Leptolyngbya sp. FACHB-711]MBD1851702.1 helix-turn-helix transcriptional regulator [Cyanobacteria bacterium FACHB-502]MBD2024907.1 helix-turn-helix transcriptional regulator [Leptolyngbya sp. FACHB-711]